LTDIGKSFENRNLTTITISNGDGRKGKNVIFIDAGMHGREWITHTAALNIIDQLVVNFKENMELLEDYDWVILPLVNVDGYTYSRSGNVFTDEAIDCENVTTFDHEIKCWRKNRNIKEMLASALILTETMVMAGVKDSHLIYHALIHIRVPTNSRSPNLRQSKKFYSIW